MKKQRNFYYNDFLPFIENLLYVNALDGVKVVNKSNIALYFKKDYRAIEQCFQQAEKDDYLQRSANTTKLRDDEYSKHSMCVYTPTPDPLFGTKLRHYTMLNTDFDLSDSASSIKSRFARYGAYTRAVKKDKPTKKEDLDELNRLKAENIYFITLLATLNEDLPWFYRTRFLVEEVKRGVNPICHTPNPNKEHKHELPLGALELRHKLLTDFFDGIEIHIEFDTNGSIYRITFALTHGYPLSHDVDVYEEMWNASGFGKPLTKEIRDHLKNLCMPIYMSNGVGKEYNANLVYQNPEKVKSKDKLKCAALNAIADYLGLKKTYINGLDIIKKLMQGMKDFLGLDEFFGKQIFIYETDLHILIWDECKRRGIKTINVYDGFYFADGTMTQETYDEIYDICTEKLLKILQEEIKNGERVS